MIKTITKKDYIEKAYGFYVKSCADADKEPVPMSVFTDQKVTNETFMKELLGTEFADINAFENDVYTYPEGYKHRLNIRLETESDVLRFANAIQDVKGSVILVGKDEEETCQINAKSIIGSLYAMTWAHITLISDEDIYFKIKEFVL